MLDFNNLRAFIENADICGNNIFLFDKPIEIKADHYILYSFKELDGGRTTREYQIDIRIVGRDKQKILDMKEKLIYLLDFYYKPCPIKGIRSLKLLNGGGFDFDNRTKEYNVFLYFKAII